MIVLHIEHCVKFNLIINNSFMGLFVMCILLIIIIIQVQILVS